MDAFESLVAMLLKREGYWTTTAYKVELTRKDKRDIGRHSCPRWEIDVLGYSPVNNEIIVIECKSLLNSKGVTFKDGHFERRPRYKLFEERVIRKVVLRRLRNQLIAHKLCPKKPKPKTTLGLAAGKFAPQTDLLELEAHFAKRNWKLYTPELLGGWLLDLSTSDYENDVAHVVAKLVQRHSKQGVRE